ncbi:hypothetical protein [Vibrio coralliilyticus]|uniref:hypothetical protein n=1 Tax=Vibrio coralliilyticus TaxID=190893 RepID=UPI0020A6113A|nr:hypothetical protein [Vibrio coralliilyticus]
MPEPALRLSGQPIINVKGKAHESFQLERHPMALAADGLADQYAGCPDSEGGAPSGERHLCGQPSLPGLPEQE